MAQIIRVKSGKVESTSKNRPKTGRTPKRVVRPLDEKGTFIVHVRGAGKEHKPEKSLDTLRDGVNSLRTISAKNVTTVETPSMAQKGMVVKISK